MNKDLPKLLRSIATGTEAKERRTDIIFDAAAVEIENLRRQVKLLGEIGDVCTYDTLGDVCDFCRCKRRQKNKHIISPTDQ